VTTDQPLHATAVAQWTPGTGWRAALIFGRSGAGKSDLALRLIGRGWRLVADDGVHVFASGAALYAVAPRTIRGRIEARGLGILDTEVCALARLVLAVDLIETAPERLPEAETWRIAGQSLPRLRLAGFEGSAVEKVAARMAAL
jgi:serine kinase of HPr protein (carbohydrate metabolism regulator)